MNRCKACNKETKNKFCSLSCSNSYNNRGVRRHGNPVTCSFCDKRILESSTYGACSEHRYDAYIELWLDGKPVKTSGGKNQSPSTYLRRWLIQQKGDCCHKCGWNEVHPKTGKVPVQYNHKNGDSTDNSPENIELLCPNCHSLTPNFGALNKGKGRAKRYTRA